MAKQNIPTEGQSYAEFLQQRDNVKQIILEHTESNQFREQHRNLIKEYHSTEEYRDKLFKQIDEHQINKLGTFIKKNFSLVVVIFVTAIVTSLGTLFFKQICDFFSNTPFNQ
jgi:hypothetical protein